MEKATGFICFYADYVANEFVSVSDEVFHDIEDIYRILDSGILEYPKNIWGIIDEAGCTLQLFVNDDNSIEIDIPAPEQEGSYIKNTSLDECIAIVRSAGRNLNELEIPDMSFRKW